MKRSVLTIFVACAIVFTIGCAISDYDGIPSHKTTAEAKLWGKEISFGGFADDVDGTYAYTVKYNTTPGVGSGKVTINSYRNPVVSSFSRDGLVDRDGDDVQGGSGTLGGKFNNQYVAVDNASGCQFDDNITQVKGGAPGILLCIGGFVEEIDADFELGAAFASLDDLIGQIWGGTLTGDFTLDLTSIRLNGVSHELVTGVEIGTTAGANRPIQFRVTNGPGVQEVIDLILQNTQSGQPISIGLGFEGGLSVNAPTNMKVAFNHDALMGL